MWFRILKDHIKNHKPLLLPARDDKFELESYLGEVNQFDVKNPKLFVWMGYVKPRSKVEKYSISVVNGDKEEVLIEEFIVPQVRTNDIPLVRLPFINVKKDEKLDRSLSKQWRSDT
jgi:hypothetical protein